MTCREIAQFVSSVEGEIDAPTVTLQGGSNVDFLQVLAGLPAAFAGKKPIKRHCQTNWA